MDSSIFFFLFKALVIFGLLIVGIVSFLPKLFHRLGGGGGGWSRLNDFFLTDGPPQGELLKRQTVQVGRVVYKRCVTVGISPQGLFLKAASLFSSRLKPLLIPWERIRKKGEGGVPWRKVTILSVGEPEVGTIALFGDLFEKIRPFMIS